MTQLVPTAFSLNEWMQDAALPLWWEKGADHERGGFHEALDARGEPVETNRRARVQARQIYVYATAGSFGWTGPWKKAVNHGLEFFLSSYLREDGLYRTVVAPDGTLVDNSAWLYDQAFALFALAQASRVMPEREDLKVAGQELFRSLQSWRWSEGGFQEPEARHSYQSNPHMHLFEAALAWAEISDEPVWGALADELAALAISKFIDTNGALHEYFGPGWAPAEGADGRIVEPGHQLEWAWLLERWARLRHNKQAHLAAKRLFEIGLEWGVRDRRGVVTQQLLDDGTIYDDVARLWPQTERIKAAILLGSPAQVDEGLQGLYLYLETPVRGLWRDKLKPDGTFVAEPAPASSFYHIVCAIAALVSYQCQFEED